MPTEGPIPSPVSPLERVSRLLDASADSLLREDFAAAMATDSEVVALLERVEPRAGSANNALLSLVTNYLKALDVATSFHNDSGEDAPSIAVFTEHALTLDPKAFDQNVLATYAIEVLFLNVRIYRHSKAAQLIRHYDKVFDDCHRAALCNRMLAAPSAKLGLDTDVRPLMRRAKQWLKTLDTQIARLRRRGRSAGGNDAAIAWRQQRKREYLTNLTGILRKLELEGDLPALPSWCRGEIKNCHGQTQAGAWAFMQTMADTGLYDNEVRAWAASLGPEGQADEGLPRLLQRLGGDRPGRPASSRYVPGESFRQRWHNLSIASTDRLVPRRKVSQDAAALIAEARSAYESAETTAERLENLRIIYALRIPQRYLDFWADFSDALTMIPQPPLGDSVYLFPESWSLVDGTLALPVLMEARKRGIVAAAVNPRAADYEATADQGLNELIGLFDAPRDLRYERTSHRFFDWKIDLAHKKITAGPYNIYQPVFEHVTRYQFTYFLNFDTDACCRQKVLHYITYMDHVLKYCEEVAAWARREGKKVRFVANASHYPQNGAYRIFCEAEGYRDDVEFVAVSAGYDNYFKNIGDARTETLTALNLTRNPLSRNSFLGTKEGFERYVDDNAARLPELRQQATQWLTAKRSQTAADSAEREAVLSRIREARASGKKVLLVIGKVIYDLGVKYTEGVCHADMSDWITDTVRYVNSRDDVLLLIKPHPHESLKSLTMTSDVVPTLRDLITTQLGTNVVYLPHNMFSIADLEEQIDLGILWNGTSAVELAAWGVPVLVCDVWGHYDYPIGFTRPASRDEYHRMLTDPTLVNAGDTMRDRAICFLHYMGSDAVGVRNPYTRTSTLNYDQFSASTILFDKVRDFARTDDPELAALFDRIH
ncbi:hypothetical protein ACFOYW_08975 [Gryllotalpicola reticulitermitis]|uniref:Capsule polysaccharide biosynthesis protein n=1 Tax=Gryllotalpicola reticulitermitis TaxID=1184153 RepID=A0ABV8Q509_9MICO